MSDDLLGDDEIQALLAQASGGASPPAGDAPGGGDASGGDAAPAASDASPPAVAAASAGASSGENLLDAGEIDSLLSQSQGGARAPAPAAASGPGPVIDEANSLLQSVESGLDAALAGGDMGRSNVMAEVSDARPFELPEFDRRAGEGNDRHSMGALDDVELDLHIELGRADLLIDEVLSLRTGAVVPLDKLAGDPVDILVNGRLLARGEVLVLNDNFCVRVAEIISPDF